MFTRLDGCFGDKKCGVIQSSFIREMTVEIWS